MTSSLATAAAPEPVQIVERSGHVSEAVVVVDASPAQVYALVTDYARWPAVFTDIESVAVERGGPRDGRVRFRSRALEHRVTVQFDNTPDRAIKFAGVAGPPGGRANGSYILEPIAGGRTRVTARLYMHVVGVPGIFVGEGKVRRMRQAKLRADMTDVVKRFAKPTS
jgi:hypothetical protein